MAWREVSHDGTKWNVTVAAERTAPSAAWRLVLSFRAAGPQRASFWMPYPLISSSKSALFAQAERIPDEKLAAVLADHLK
ncbi:MAG: hypothetical protein AB7I33_14765 [Gemmatimonadales bacterium]